MDVAMLILFSDRYEDSPIAPIAVDFF